MGSSFISLSNSSTFSAEIPTEVIKALKTIVNPKDGKVSSITPAPIKGLYEVVVGTKVFYVSDDGKHFIKGDIHRTQTKQNLTKNKRTSLRTSLIDALGEQKMIVFTPEQGTSIRLTCLPTSIAPTVSNSIKTFLNSINTE